MPSVDFLRGVCHATATWAVAEANRGSAVPGPCEALPGVFGLEGVTTGAARQRERRDIHVEVYCRWFFLLKQPPLFHFFQQSAAVCLENRASQRDSRHGLTSAQAHFPQSQSVLRVVGGRGECVGGDVRTSLRRIPPPPLQGFCEVGGFCAGGFGFIIFLFTQEVVAPWPSAGLQPQAGRHC